jgi:hypothetical protein
MKNRTRKAQWKQIRFFIFDNLSKPLVDDLTHHQPPVSLAAPKPIGFLIIIALFP